MARFPPNCSEQGTTTYSNVLRFWFGKAFTLRLFVLGPGAETTPRILEAEGYKRHNVLDQALI